MVEHYQIKEPQQSDKKRKKDNVEEMDFTLEIADSKKDIPGTEQDIRQFIRPMISGCNKSSAQNNTKMLPV